MENRAADLIPILYVVFITEILHEFMCFLSYTKQPLWFQFIELWAGLWTVYKRATGSHQCTFSWNCT